MSTQVDNYVASMEFDNSKFEKNVATSMSTLEKLKQKLNLDGASKGLEEINAAAGKVNMSGLGSGVDAVKAKFSALDVVAVTALANITNKAVDAGEKLVKSLSVDQITAGWQKFSNMTTSTATLVAQGNDIADVNAQLDRLLYYTDETSYNFTEMVANIAKFTATGKGLEESVTAMEGIANWAALSGQNASTASRAMYQLSQAMGAGVMRLEDYKSIQNASMDTEEFRQKCIDAAISLGTLKDNGNGTYTSLVKGASSTSFSISQFTTQLTEGMWLTSDVMMEVFNTYSSAVGAILDRADETDSLVSEVIDEIHDKADELKTDTMSDSEAIDAAIKELGYTLEDGSLMFDSFGLKALEAAQKARTFSDAIDSVKDAVSSQWMKTFQLIFGDANQATELWTNVANQLWDIFAGGGETRNDHLTEVMVSGWDRLVERINDAGIETDDYEQALRECAKAGGVDIDGLIKKYGSLSEVFKNGALSTDYLTEAFDKLKSSSSTTTKSLSADLDSIERQLGWGSAGDDVKELQTALEELGHSVGECGLDGLIGPDTTAAIKEFQKEAGLAVDGIAGPKTLAALKEAAASIENIGDASEKSEVSIDDLVDSITRPSGQELLFDTISNSLTAVSKVIETFREAWGEIFTDDRVTSGMYNALLTIQKASESLVNFLDTNADKLKSTFKGVIAILDILTSIVGGALSAAFEIFGEILGTTDASILDITGSVGDAIVWFRDWLAENNLITKEFNKLVSAAKKVIAIIKRWIDAFADIPFISDLLEGIKQLFADISSDVNDGTDKVDEWVGAFDGLSVVSKILDKVGEAVEWVGDAVEAGINIFSAWFEVFKETEGVQHLIEGVTDLIDAFSKLFSGELDAEEFASALGKSLGEITASIPEMAIQIGKDFIAGFSNGLSEGVGEIISDILEFCGTFISSFMEGLGEHSPSVIAEEAGVNWIQGFINGIESMLEPLMTAIQPIIDFVKNVFSSFWGYITDESGNIDWNKLVVGGITIESLVILNKFAESMQTLSGALTSFSGIFSSIKGVFSQLKLTIAEVGKAAKWDLTANAVMKMAIAVGILAAAIFVLAKIDDIGKLWNAVGVIVVLAAVIAGLAWVMTQLGDASISFSAAEKKLDISGMKTTLLQLGIALLLMAATVKIIGSMKANEAEQGLTALLAMMAGLMIFMIAMGKISSFAGDVSSFGSMMTKMAVAMLLMAVVVKLVGKLEKNEMIKGAEFAAALMVFVIAIGRVAKSSGNNVSKFGTMVIKLAVAMGLLVGVCKLVDKLSAGEMLKGAAFAAAFVLFIKALVKVTKVGKKQKLAEVGGVVLGAGAAMLLMAAACKIVSSLSWGEIAKGLACVVAFSLVLAALISLLKISNEQQMGKVAGSLIGASIAILIMAGTAVILSMIPIEDLWKGVAIVSVFGLIMAAMAKSLQGANNVQQSIKAMAVCIALMAAAVIALSFLDEGDLIRCTAAMLALMGMFTLMISSLKGLEKGKVPTGALIALMGVLLVLGGVIVVMTHLMKDSATAIAAAESLSMVILAFALAFKLMDKVQINKTVADNISTMALCMAGLGGVLAIMSLFPHASSMIENAVSLGILINCLASAMLILDKVQLNKSVADKLYTMSFCIAILGGVLAIMSLFPHASSMIENAISLGILINCLASALLILNKVQINKTVADNISTMALCMAGLGVVLAIMSALPHNSSMIENAISLGILINCLASAMLILDGVKLNKSVTDNLLIMSGCMAILGLVLGLMSAFPHASSMIENAISLGILINCLASALLIASLAGSNASGAASAMRVMAGVLAIVGLVLGLLVGFDVAPSIETALALSVLMLALSAACLIVSMIPAGAGLTGALELAKFIGVMALVVAAAGALAQIPGFNELLADGGTTLGLVGQAIGNFVGGIIAGVGSAIISLIPQLGMALSVFSVGLQPFLAVVGSMSAGTVAKAGFLTATIGALTAAAFVEGITSLFGLGLPSLGADLAEFGSHVATFSGYLNGVSPESVAAAENVASMLLALTANNVLDGLTSWLVGDVNYEELGTDLKNFGEAVVGFSETISGKVDVEAIEAATRAGELLVALQEAIPKSGGSIQDIFGENDFSAFATACGEFAECILTINETLSQEGFVIQEEKFKQLATAGTLFSDLNNAIPKSEGWLQDVIGTNDFTNFADAVEHFAGCVLRINESLSAEGLVIQEEKIDQLVTAGTKFSDLNNAIPKSEGWLQDVIGKDDLSAFGDAIEHFVGCLITVNEALSQEGFAVNLDAMEDLKQAGLKMNELEGALPESEGWWKKVTGTEKDDLADFGEKIKTFAEAIGSFSTAGAAISTAGVALALSAAEQLKDFMTSLIGMDYSGVDAFTGIGTGGFGADGPAYDIACAIAKFGDKVADIDTEAVPIAVTAAERLKSLIASLVGLDTTGIENFKPGEIGDQMKSYSDKVANIDTTVVSSSITSANRLKSFIAGLIDLDTSGVSNFNPESVGTAIQSYSNSVSGINLGAVSSSITAALRLKSFIAELAGLDTSGVGSFESAIEQLSTVNITGLAQAFSGASSKLFSAGADMIDSLGRGMHSRASVITTISNGLVTSASKVFTSKLPAFATAGENLSAKLASGMARKIDTVGSAASACVTNAVSKIRDNYDSFYSAGSYLVDGFAAGISENSYKAAAKATAMAEAAEKAAREALKINSPSKIFKDIGSGIPEGLSLGIDENTGMVTDSVTGLSYSAIDAADALKNLGSDTTLSYGDTGEDVRNLQTALESLGHSVGACSLDGLLGPDTTAAIKEFQEEAGLAVNGIAGPETLQALAKAAGEIDNVGSSFSSLLDGVDITEYFNLGSDGGTNFIDGIISGIDSKSDYLNGIVDNLGTGLLGSFNGSIDAHSPSRETMKSGKWFCEGIIIGIKNMEGSVGKASEGIGQTALNATRSAMSSVLEALNSDMDAQPTIRPVVDLSDVQTGVNAISGMFAGTQSIGVQSNLNAINVAMNRKLQNGTNDDIISAINKLNDGLEGNHGDTYNFAGITYDNGNEISDAVQTLVRAAKMGRRV